MFFTAEPIVNKPITDKRIFTVIVEPLYCKRSIPCIVRSHLKTVNTIDYNKGVIALVIVGAFAGASSIADV